MFCPARPIEPKKSYAVRMRGLVIWKKSQTQLLFNCHAFDFYINPLSSVVIRMKFLFLLERFSKVIRVLLWLCDWLKNLAPFSRPIRSKTQTNQSRLARARTFSPALDASKNVLASSSDWFIG